MRCGYCDEVFDDATPHYCVAGRNWIVADNKCLRAEIASLTAEVARINAENRRLTDEALTDIESLEAAERERDEALREVEALVWNLAGCGTIAESGKPQDFNRAMARPALLSVNDMAVRLQAAERELAALRASVRWCKDNGYLIVSRLPPFLNAEMMPREHAEALELVTEQPPATEPTLTEAMERVAEMVQPVEMDAETRRAMAAASEVCMEEMMSNGTEPTPHPDTVALRELRQSLRECIDNRLRYPGLAEWVAALEGLPGVRE